MCYANAPPFIFVPRLEMKTKIQLNRNKLLEKYKIPGADIPLVNI